MFKIGEFYKLSQVTVKTLRYYDETGLLKPAKVDRFTSYRHYSADLTHPLAGSLLCGSPRVDARGCVTSCPASTASLRA